MNHRHSSRQCYQEFVRDYKQQRLDDSAKAGEGVSPSEAPHVRGGKRREYLHEYLRWLWPHRYAVGVVFVFAILAAGLQMLEPLFMRFIIDRVLLNTDLNAAESRLTHLHIVGAAFLGAILLSSQFNAWKDYRQRLLNVQVTLSLRRALFDRLLHLPLPKLWDMKTGGILSRLTGDVDTTTGLLQMAVVSPAISNTANQLSS